MEEVKPEDSLPTDSSATAANSSSTVPTAKESEDEKWSRATISVAKHTNPVLGC